MTRKEFIEFLEKHEIPFEEYTNNGADMIYVYERKSFDAKKEHPRKNKDLFVPYLRVSHFDERSWYTRDCGHCCHMNPKKVLELCLRRFGA